MKQRNIKKLLLGAGALLTAGVVSASAMGMPHMQNLSADEIATRQSGMFKDQATLIGASLDEVKTAWAEGKDFRTLAKEKGVTEEQLQTKMKAAREAQLKSELATLVSKGVITQAQADKRLATLATRSTSNNGKGKHGKAGMMKGMMGGLGF